MLFCSFRKRPFASLSDDRRLRDWSGRAVVSGRIRRARQFAQNEFGNVRNCEAAHFEQVQLNSGSRGIALCPQLSHCNQPSTRSSIRRNSFPTLQYGHLMIGSVWFGINIWVLRSAKPSSGLQLWHVSVLPGNNVRGRDVHFHRVCRLATEHLARKSRKQPLECLEET